MCINTDVLNEVDYSECEGLPKPGLDQPCNTEPCLYTWKTHPWGKVRVISFVFVIHCLHNVVPLDMKGCICHFTKWQIHPFISKVARYFLGACFK